MTILTYNGANIEQREDSYVNISQLCATHNKKFAHWNENISSKAYLEALSEEVGIPIGSLCIVKNGFMTWVHPLVAIEVARWLSPKFGVWANMHIKTLMEEGSTHLTEDDTKAAKLIAELLEFDKERLHHNKAASKARSSIYKHIHELNEMIERKQWLDESKDAF